VADYVAGVYLLPILDATPPARGYLDEALAKGLQALADGTMTPGFVHTMDVYHDDWCDLLAGKGPCNCNPDVKPPKKPDPPEGGHS
jgi:hypothetical protein